uniref:Uncharacterized protein n=1 Tax=Capra hircus TaxID=9925 RepID=A0A452ELI8_CAPHI
VLAFFIQNMNIKCCKFLCQVVQKYIINNLVKKKKRNSKPSCNRFIITGFTKWLRKKREGKVASTALQGTPG